MHTTKNRHITNKFDYKYALLITMPCGGAALCGKYILLIYTQGTFNVNMNIWPACVYASQLLFIMFVTCNRHVKNTYTAVITILIFDAVHYLLQSTGKIHVSRICNRYTFPIGRCSMCKSTTNYVDTKCILQYRVCNTYTSTVFNTICTCHVIIHIMQLYYLC